jgi:8-oxo-dGTP diphosphatase
MKRMNVIAVYSPDMTKLLMCKRTKNPYKDLYNFVGGKIDVDNDDLNEAYRELKEETNISKEDIELVHLMRSTYYRAGLELEVFYGVLKHDVELIEEVNKLEWIEIEGENFFDMKKYAGEGNIGHILEWIKYDMNK